LFCFNILAPGICWLNRICDLHIYLAAEYLLKRGARIVLLIMDISFVSDGWSYKWNPEGFRPDQASGSQQPPPAPPNLAKVMARQTELLNQLVQAQMNQFYHPSRGCDEHPSAGYQDFLSTQPPLFHKTDEPLDADAWLCTIESKFALLSAPCSDANKALFAAEQLHGTARIWWSQYYTM
jgi:hypothetical protein